MLLTPPLGGKRAKLVCLFFLASPVMTANQRSDLMITEQEGDAFSWSCTPPFATASATNDRSLAAAMQQSFCVHMHLEDLSHTEQFFYSQQIVLCA